MDGRSIKIHMSAGLTFGIQSLSSLFMERGGGGGGGGGTEEKRVG